MHRLKAVLVALGLVASCSVQAQTQAQAPGVRLNMDSGFYAGAGVGRAQHREFCDNIGGACDENDTTWNIFAGYKINRHFAIELGYADLGKATTSGLIGGIGVTVQQDTTLIELTGLGILPLSDAFSLYGKFGMFRHQTDASATGAIVGTFEDKQTGFTMGFGAQYNFTPALAVRAEWQRYLDVGAGVFGLEKDDASVWRLSGLYKF